MEFFQEKYYTVDKIPKYRLEYIDLKVKKFLEELDLNEFSWPLDCMALIERIVTKKVIHLELKLKDMPLECDGFSDYLPDSSQYVIFINKNKVRYPYQTSEDRRLNFTLAHEIAHVYLGHTDVPRDAKTEEELDLEELEANEFAGRLLMPDKLVSSCNFYHIHVVAAHFLVSKTALWVRLNNLKKLPLLKSRPLRTCPGCGNTHFTAFAEFCGICGRSIRGGLKGIRRLYHEEDIEAIDYNRALQCPNCSRENIYAAKCPYCQTHMFNVCSDFIEKGEAGCTNSCGANHRYCELCGEPTYYFKQGYLMPWKDRVLLNRPAVKTIRSKWF